MEYQALFSLENNKKIFIMSSAAVVIGVLRVNLSLFGWLKCKMCTCTYLVIGSHVV